MDKKKKSNPTKDGEFPGFLYPLFWEYEPKDIDIRQHATLIIGRIMERGSWSAMIWLQKTYSKAEISSFLEKTGRHALPPRELSYWSLINGISAKKRGEWVKDAWEKSDVWNTRHSR
jgi:hypothetical protein